MGKRSSFKGTVARIEFFKPMKINLLKVCVLMLFSFRESLIVVTFNRKLFLGGDEFTYYSKYIS